MKRIESKARSTKKFSSWETVQSFLGVKLKTFPSTTTAVVNKKDLKDLLYPPPPPERHDKKGLSTGAIVGIVVGALVVVIAIVILVLYCACKKGKKEVQPAY